VLTVDYDRLGIRAGDRLLDLGCGGGRHAVEAALRGALVVALDADEEEVRATVTMLGALGNGNGKGPPPHAGVRADAGRLPFPDGAFDRVVAAEVLEHLVEDGPAMAELARVVRPGGTLAVTVPRWLPERLCWALSEDYHAPAVPGGHVRVYRRRQLLAGLRDAGLKLTGSHHAHALHSPYWWLKCAVGPTNEEARLPRLYHRFLVWDLTVRPRSTRLLERALNPLVGKSLVVYLEKLGEHAIAAA
jgi:SAM-dependent methyltransferase